MSVELSLANKVALVSGGSRGIGRSVTKAVVSFASTLPAFGLSEFGLSESDLDRPVASGDSDRPGTSTVRQLRSRLEETYCRTLGVELAHLHDRDLRRWLERRMERTGNRVTLAPEGRRRLLRKLTEAELFEQFAGKRFLGAKRFSAEGAESMVALLELVVDRAIGHGVRNLVIGMAHRGRLNVMAHVLGKPYEQILAEFKDPVANTLEIEGVKWNGDVKYHLGASRAIEGGEEVDLVVSMPPNTASSRWPSRISTAGRWASRRIAKSPCPRRSLGPASRGSRRWNCTCRRPGPTTRSAGRKSRAAPVPCSKRTSMRPEKYSTPNWIAFVQININ